MSRVDEVIDRLRRLQEEIDGEVGQIRSDYPSVDFDAGFEWSVPLQPSRPTTRNADDPA